eukprot:14969754-Ditylum_brightwellii.AAC.1
MLWGTANTNLILDTIVYECEFPHGTIKYLGANIIAESVYIDADDEGHFYLILDMIVDRQKMRKQSVKRMGGLCCADVHKNALQQKDEI